MERESRIAALFADCPRSSKQTATTHVSRGVRYNLLDDELCRRFCASLQSDIQDNVRYSVHEVPGTTFRMFFKFAFSVAERLDDMAVCELAQIIHGTMQRFYPPNAAVMIPAFFEQIWMQAASARQCATRSELFDFVAKRPLLTDGAVIRIVDGSVEMLDGRRIAPVWQIPPRANGIYKIIVKDDTVTLDTKDKPRFENPQVYSEACANTLRYSGCPPDAVSVEDERNKMASSIRPIEYTPETVFCLGDGAFFKNVCRTNGCVPHEISVVFPELVVDAEQALTMREALIAGLTLAYGAENKLATNGWHRVLDATAYVSDGPGLRVYGSQNTVDCMCGGKRSCHRDCKNGKIYNGEEITLRTVFIDGLRRDDYEDHYHRQVALIIRRGSILTAGASTTPGWQRYHGAPQYLEEVKTFTTKKGDVLTSLKSFPGTGQRRSAFKTDRPMTRGTTTPVTDSRIIAALQTAIRTRFVKTYERLCVTSVVLTQDQDTLFITVIGEGQHYCLNLNPAADHPSNTIYFQCDRAGICQRCRCSDPTEEGRRKGPCKTFKSRVLPLTRMERDILFAGRPPSRPKVGKRER